MNQFKKGTIFNMTREHNLITLASKGTQLVSKSEQNTNIVNRPYLVNNKHAI